MFKIRMPMNEFTGILKSDVSFNAKGQPIISFTVNEKIEVLQAVDELKDCEKLSIKFGKYHPKRSLNQNGYFWQLCGKLSAKIGIPPKNIYREYIKDIGGNYEVTPIKNEAVAKWVEIWEKNGIGFIAEDLGESKLQGFRNIRNYYGSSTYDTAQMTRLLELVIADCKENGIETMTPEELARLEM